MGTSSAESWKSTRCRLSTSALQPLAASEPARANRLTTRTFLGLRHLRIVQSAGDVAALDDELDVETGQQDLIEQPDDQLALANG